MASKRDFYEVLGVAKSAGADEIKRAYRKLALEWHPDRNKSADANDRFKEINEAYSVLSDPQKKDAYDRFGHAAFAPGGGMGGGAAGQGPFGGFGQGPFSYSYSSTGGFGGAEYIDPFEIFEQFFGGFGGGRPGGRARKPVYEIAIDFMDAVNGITKEVAVPKGGAGEGSVKRSIKIPAGVDTGSRIRFDDFDVVLSVRPHKTFSREGNDIVVSHSVPFHVAALGGVVDVPTIHGDVKIRIQPGTQGGTVIRLRGQGVPSVHGAGKGDEYVKVVIGVPEKLSKRQKELLSELGRSFDG